jgi:hypothetical protein
MKAIIVKNLEQVTIFNEAITPVMLAAGQVMMQWIDHEQCPFNIETGEYAIITESEGIRREIIEKYLADNRLTEVSIDRDDKNWFPKIDINTFNK